MPVMKLWHKVLIGLILGVVAGMAIREYIPDVAWVMETLSIIGELFVNLIRMLVIPLIFTTLVAGVLSMGDPRKLGSIGLKAVILYMLTTAFAIGIGLTLGTVLEPGAGVELADAVPRVLGERQSTGEMIRGLVPENILQSMAQTQVLPTIIFSIFFGIGVLVAGDKGKPIGDAVVSASEVVIKIALMVMALAPYGVFALIAHVVAQNGFGVLEHLLMLAVALYGGCLIHIVFVHGTLVRIFARLPVLTFFRGVISPQLVAYSTSSSAATLPVTMAAAENNLGIKTPVAGSVLPLGATVNMDGTALYVGLVTLFAAQVFGIPLSWGDYAMVAVMTTLVSIGTAAVPSASLFLIAGVLTQIGLDDAAIALVVGFIYPFDRILDMMRTVTNVTGDLAVATTVAKWEGEIDEEVYRAPNNVG
jgi:Na+/H+-dicarboxylate symporter